MTPTTYLVLARWRRGQESASRIGARLLEAVDQMARLSPAFPNWEFVERMGADSARGVPVNHLRSRMTAFVEGQVVTDDFGEPEPESGYNVTALGAVVVADHDTPRRAALKTSTGSSWGNELSFEIGDSLDPADPNLVTYPIYREALETLASAWPCPWVSVEAIRHSRIESKAWMPPGPDASGAEFLASIAAAEPPPPERMIWIYYLSPPLAAGLAPPADLAPARTPGGGLILSAATTPFDLDDPECVRRGRMLERIIAERVGDWDASFQLDARIGPY
jgi:hypothetical protein